MATIAAFLAFVAAGLVAMGLAVRIYDRRPMPVLESAPGSDARGGGLREALTRLASALMGPTRVAAVDLTLLQGGRPYGWTGEQVVALQLAGAAAGVFLLLPMAFVALGPGGILLGAFGGLLVYMAPQALVDRRKEARQRELARDLPDAIDLMAVGVEAGMAMHDAMRQLALRVKDPIREELLRTVQDMMTGTREQALSAMAERTGLPAVARLAWILHQGARYGTPVAETLRQYGADLRRSRSLDLQARAASLPVKLLGPMFIFGLLPIMVIVLGPIAIQIAKLFRM